MVPSELLTGLDSTPNADLLFRTFDPLQCARNAVVAPSSSGSEQSCVPGTHRHTLETASGSTTLPVLKSLKRRQAEIALAAQYAKGDKSTIRPSQCKRQKADSAETITVAACKLASCSRPGAQTTQWCGMPVELGPCIWASLLSAVCGSDADDGSCAAEQLGTSSSRPAEGASSSGGRRCSGAGGPLGCPGGPSVHVVEDARQLPAALAHLRASMRDPVVAIDLEWRPDFGAGRSRVALLQLASSGAAVLVRTCRLPKGPLPGLLLDFLRDPSITLVGFGWDGADEGKMRSSFGVGRACFGAFLDLQRVAAGLGYSNFSLSALAARVLALDLPKPRSVVMSNWEARRLGARQVAYAALDALVTGWLLRGLRLWHSSPSACPGCRSAVGAPVDPRAALGCAHAGCSRSFASLEGLRQHARGTGHRPSGGACADCGRLTALRRGKRGRAGGRARAEQEDLSACA